ncbi:uncharacterized protein LOC132883505 [Neoarius graeffei]|uniref:uncharacterized protein LOC132883505 n=1 Tax=Neoarius graeffei TaxID=443677 RepID=UPI00298C73C2|nr:uncharacterized protein LOC132883505 [Neoarius graeffei]XP_060773197.1 uncharacterized protein LOC132883505 [Neoarius graeffei]
MEGKRQTILQTCMRARSYTVHFTSLHRPGPAALASKSVSVGMTSSTKKNAFNSWKLRHHFIFKEDKGNNTIVQCKLCIPAVKHLSSSKDSTSNLKKHLQRKHPRHFNEEREDTVPPEMSDHGQEQEVSHPPFKQAKFGLGTSTSQSAVSRLIFEFVIDDVQPFSLVEQPSFKKLIEGISGGKTVMCRKTLVQRIEREFVAMKENLTATLKKVAHVCTTADLWTAHNRSFFGMTCHWIEEDTLERRSAALACVRVKGRHTFDVLAAKICEIHADFKVQHKVRATVTDNGSNFVKAFREFEATEETAPDDCDDGIRFLDMDAVLEMEGDEELQFFLPPHQRCAAHTLNLIATNEVDKAASTGPSRRVYRSAMGKCAFIWNKAHRSSAAAEVVQDIASMRVSVPCATRWSSEYMAISKLIGLTEDQLGDICTRLGGTRLNPHEMTFLREYVAVLQPLAQSIDLLQGEKKCFLGFLIPTILSLKSKLSEKLANVTLTAHIITAVINAIDSRFGAMLSSHEAKMATTTMPKFRLCWLPAEKKENMCKTLIQEAASLDTIEPLAAAVNTVSDSDGSDEDFFVFGKTNSSDKTTAEEEVRRFLDDPAKSLDSLNAFPLVKQLFMKYNTTLPSSAPVERLFSYGGNVLTSSRSRMSDDHMEQVLLLRYNRKFCPKLGFD